MATIRQVANKAGVSIGTVSRVLNNKSGVGEKTRQRVLGVACELGYTIPRRSASLPAPVAQLGLLHPPMHGGLTNPFYHNVFLGVEQTCRDYQINLSFNTLDMSHVESEHLRSLPPLLNTDDLSGIILIGAIPQTVLLSLTSVCSLPIVLVDNCFPDTVWDSVMIDNVRGIALLTELLIAKGHSHIALVSGPNRPSIVERRLGYERVMEQHQLPTTIVSPNDLMPPGAEAVVTQILAQAPETTAIICSTDLQAVATVKKLQQLGYQVPEDISVTGFDDIDMAQYTSPPLTTVQVDRMALGQIATEILLARIQNPTRPVMKTVVGVKLTERASVCSARMKKSGRLAYERT